MKTNQGAGTIITKDGFEVKVWIVIRYDDDGNKSYFHYAYKVLTSQGTFYGRLDGDDIQYLDIALNRFEKDLLELVQEAVVIYKNNCRQKKASAAVKYIGG